MKAVLITGASSGIGKACAVHLDKKGVRVFAGVRNEADGAALKQNTSDRLEPVLIDVTKSDTVESAHRQIADAIDQGGLAGLVNSAGMFAGGPLEFTSLDDVRQEFAVNFFGVMAVTQAFLSLLRTGHGRIVNMSSASGLIAFPFLGPYAASKFALEALSDSWRVELKPWGISVAVVEPGLVDTPFQEKVLVTLRKARETFPPEARDLYGPVFGHVEEGSKRRKWRGIPAERVAEAVDHGLFSRRPKARYLVGRDATAISVFRKLPVRLRDYLITRHLPRYG